MGSLARRSLNFIEVLEMLTLLPDHVKACQSFIRAKVATENSLTGQIRSFVGYNPFGEPNVEAPKNARAKALAAAMLKGVDDCDDDLYLELSLRLAPFVQAYALYVAAIKEREQMIKAAAQALPVAPWLATVRGLGLKSLGEIIGQTGDLRNYSNPAKVWKRLGLAVIDGERQGNKVSGDTEKGLRHGYAPKRRTVMHLVGENLIRAKNPVYYPLYIERKAYEATKTDSKILAHRRAMRYMQKRLLVALWVEWQRATGAVPSDVSAVA
jgi:hypothetical protein